MKIKRTAALILSAALLLAAIPCAVSGATLSAFSVSFDKNELTAGEISAYVTVQHLGEAENAFVSLAYYDADATVESFCGGVCTLNQSAYYSTLYSGSITLSIDVPEDVSDGNYVRVIVMSQATLEPYTPNSDADLYFERIEYNEEDIEYTGMFERYYTLDGADASIAIASSAVTAASEGTSFRLKDMGEGYVAFVDSTGSGESRRLYYDSGVLGRRLYGLGSVSMLWKLTEAEDGCYYIEHYNGGYLAIENDEAVVRDLPYAFELTKVKESPFTLMTSLEGYKLLSDAQKQRITEICTGVGAVIFPDGTNSTSFLATMEEKFEELYKNASELSASEQAEEILEIVSTPPRYNSGETNELNSATIASLPGDDAQITQSDPVVEYLYIWDLGYGYYSRTDVTYTTEASTQTVKVYSNDITQANVQTAIEALARFPYEYRQNIVQMNIYVPESSFTYNCDGTVITVRVADGSGVETMVRNFAHELGHSADFCADETPWCQSEEWQQAIQDDIATVSVYGNSNDYEGLAEFARLYFQCYSNRDRQIGIKQLFPNRLASFERLLAKLGMEPLY